jgi:hypothetical protein
MSDFSGKLIVTLDSQEAGFAALEAPLRVALARLAVFTYTLQLLE